MKLTISDRASKFADKHVANGDKKLSSEDVKFLIHKAYAAGWEAGKRDARNGG